MADSLQPPFSLRVFDLGTTIDSPTSSLPRPDVEVIGRRNVPVPLFPASYRTDDNNIMVAKPDDLDYVCSELNVKRLNELHNWLWIVGRPMPPRALHMQRIKSREIFVTEQMDLHLVWAPKAIYVKPIPRFLLDPGFWQAYLGGDQQLYAYAIGFLLSYAALIEHESDYRIAMEKHLLPDEVTWSQWVLLVEQLLSSPYLSHMNKRYLYGELRLGRLNLIYRLGKGRIRGYLNNSTTYSTFVRDNLSSLITLFAYITIVLSAMQVGLATHHLQDNGVFHQVSYVFAVFSIATPLFAIAVIAATLTGIFLYNLFATLIFRKQRFGA